LQEASDRINRHFEVNRPSPVHIDEFAADIPLAHDGMPAPADARSTDRVKQS
jgi:hypothetical protein